MARGFESKDVEWQQQEAEERRSAVRRPALTPAQIEILRKRESLELQRTRVLRELAACRAEQHRRTLEAGLEYLEQQLAALEADAV